MGNNLKTQEETSRTALLLQTRQRALVDAILEPDDGGAALEFRKRRNALDLAVALWGDALLQHHRAIEESKREGKELSNAQGV